MNTTTTPIVVTITFLRHVYMAAEMGGSRYKADMFGDRLQRAASEPTLEKFCESLLRLCRPEGERLSNNAMIEMFKIINTADAPRILLWLRSSSKLAAAITTCFGGGDDFIAAINAINLPDSSSTPDRAAVRTTFDVSLRAEMLAPLAHGSDGKAGNATLFRRIKVRGVAGTMMDLPYYSGNAVRGQLRDLLADHFTAALGLKPDRAEPAYRLWFFHSLYAGGALEEKSDATKAIIKSTGDNGAIRPDGIRVFREMLPALSLLGCALGNRVLPGRFQTSDLRPECAEWGTGETPVAELMAWEFLTRREDHENHDEHIGMIANTEVLRTGTALSGGVDIDHSARSVEKSALGLGLKLLGEKGFLGAENRRGFGKCLITVNDAPDPAEYLDHLSANKDHILTYLQEINALPKL